MFPKSSSLQQVKIITENKYLLPGYMRSSSTRKKRMSLLADLGSMENQLEAF
jgi:hypothetical protein